MHQCSQKILEHPQSPHIKKNLQDKYDIKVKNCIENTVINRNIANKLSSKTHDVSSLKYSADISCPKTDAVVLPKKDQLVSSRGLRVHFIHRVNPEYPRKAKVLGIEGRIIVQYDINVNGTVKNIRILLASPVGVFEKCVNAAMRTWRYESNRPEKNLVVTFRFCLHDKIVIKDSSYKVHKK
ncbi:TonB family protein [Candidatus Blochmannia ocreatus (nom. nud.)]|uniref:Protein TonB n=1 Tax=Candidatus Blochmannia ocreatus (nom. nud.) TaxID=251538 RepID=A0ABY4SVA0_9ENTR|nr:TonB family protein [Candidatus Blochmannia ocreatus]URJ24930.1 TonB family protein [Candidatus Blochmannia ocreatus]